ncbi:hypothetical protein H4Q26_005533, partial [Puccinia striiformis f. sp. tritici PST-130]
MSDTGGGDSTGGSVGELVQGGGALTAISISPALTGISISPASPVSISPALTGMNLTGISISPALIGINPTSSHWYQSHQLSPLSSVSISPVLISPVSLSHQLSSVSISPALIGINLTGISISPALIGINLTIISISPALTVFSSSSQKRKSSSLTDSANKRSVHQLANDVSQRANLIDPPSIRHSVNSSEFSLDHHQSRTSEDKTQTTDSHTIKSNLFDRITLPPS